MLLKYTSSPRRNIKIIPIAPKEAIDDILNGEKPADLKSDE